MHCFIHLITYKLFGMKRWSDFEQEGLLLSVWVVRFARFVFCDIPDVKTKDLPASWPPNIWRHTPLFIATPFSPSILLLQIIKLLYFCIFVLRSGARPRCRLLFHDIHHNFEFPMWLSEMCTIPIWLKCLCLWFLLWWTGPINPDLKVTAWKYTHFIAGFITYAAPVFHYSHSLITEDSSQNLRPLSVPFRFLFLPTPSTLSLLISQD